MALVRKEAGQKQGEVSRGVIPSPEDGSRVNAIPQNWRRAGQAEGPEVLGRHLKPGRGPGVRGKGKGLLTFAPPLPQKDLTTALSHRNHSLPFTPFPCPSQDGTPASSCLP